MGGGKIAGIGWACGVERLSMLFEGDVSRPRPIAVIPVGDEAKEKALEISYALRKAGFSVDQAYSGNIKKRMIKANKANASHAVIIGGDELLKGEATIKNLDSGDQKQVVLAKVVEEIN